jgi:hypothetical protein
MQKIFTEDPDYEQWQMLSNFIYPSNIERFFEKRGIEKYDKELLELISGSILQAQEYFYANTLVSLNTSPLLLYYGVVNLLFAASILVSAKNVHIENHGMKLETTTGKRLAETEFTPYFSTEHGGLFQFCTTFCPNINVSRYSSQGKWTLLEILGSIPELKLDFETCYGTQSYVIPIQIVKNKSDYVERINLNEFNNLDVLEELLKVDDFEKSYIKPKLESDWFKYQHVFLRRRIGGRNISESSVFGQVFLQKSHSKQNHRITLPSIIYMYMGLFVLGYLSRYKPAIWIPFVRSDSTGEKQVIEKFLKICKRTLPNIVLNFIYETKFYFVKEMYEPLNLSKEVTEEQIRKIVSEEIKRYLQEDTQ